MEIRNVFGCLGLPSCYQGRERGSICLGKKSVCISGLDVVHWCSFKCAEAEECFSKAQISSSGASVAGTGKNIQTSSVCDDFPVDLCIFAFVPLCNWDPIESLSTANYPAYRFSAVLQISFCIFWLSRSTDRSFPTYQLVIFLNSVREAVKKYGLVSDIHTGCIFQKLSETGCV